MTKQTSPKYSPEVRERAVRMVFEHAGEHASQWAAIGSMRRRLAALLRRLSRILRMRCRPGSTSLCDVREGCGAGSGRLSATRASGPVRQATTGSGSRRWSARSGSCVRRTRSCGPVRSVFHRPDRSHGGRNRGSGRALTDGLPISRRARPGAAIA
jgi:hypothetical protein